MNIEAVRAIYGFEMSRWGRTLMQSIVSPVLSTCLYFIVFGSAIGSRISQVDGVGLRVVYRSRPRDDAALDAEHTQRFVRHLLPALHRDDLRASFGTRLPFRDRSRLCRRCGDEVGHPRAARARHGEPFRAASHCASPLDDVVPGAHGDHLQHAGIHHRDMGRWFEKLQIIPLLIITPLTFLGGTFYSVKMLPPFWQKVTLLNPVVYLISGISLELLRDLRRECGVSLLMTFVFLLVCMSAVWWIFKTGYRLKA